MTPDIRTVTVRCPRCGTVYEDWYQPCAILMPDDPDEDSPDPCPVVTCKACGYSIDTETLVLDADGILVLPEE